MPANLGAGGRLRSFSGARHLQMTTGIGTTTVMPARANGTFEVKLSPQPADETGVGRLTIDRQFHGHLEATSKGHMLAYSTEVQGSAGYVALEESAETLCIEQLCVHPAHEEEGVDFQLLDWAEGYAISLGAGRLEIVVEAGNDRAVDFYRRRGFIPAGDDVLALVLPQAI